MPCSARDVVNTRSRVIGVHNDLCISAKAGRRDIEHPWFHVSLHKLCSPATEDGRAEKVGFQNDEREAVIASGDLTTSLFSVITHLTNEDRLKYFQALA